MQVPVEDLFKIVEAFVAGALLGLEREYRSKPAGLRTIIMITVGSTLFSILSITISHVSPDRIASNIVTGVGFVGAGVIFKEGLSLKGITTAASIWAAAAIGMAIGFGEYYLATVTLGVVLFTLIVLPKAEEKLDSEHLVKTYTIKYNDNSFSRDEVKAIFEKLKLHFKQVNVSKEINDVTIKYSVRAIAQKHHELEKALLENNSLSKVEY